MSKSCDLDLKTTPLSSLPSPAPAPAMRSAGPCASPKAFWQVDLSERTKKSLGKRGLFLPGFSPESQR